MSNQRPARRRLNWLAAPAAVAAMAATTAIAQDSIVDRLSPGNSPDFIDKERMNDEREPTRFDAPGPEQVWYRGQDGRFFYRDNTGLQIYEEQVYPNARVRTRAYRSNGPRLGVAVAPFQNGGLRVIAVQPGSPAAQAGVRQGDVIRRYGDDDVTTPEAFVGSIRSMSDGDEVRLQLDRNGQQVTVRPRVNVQLDSTQEYRAAKPVVEWADDDTARSSNDYETLRREVNALRRDFDNYRRESARPVGAAVETPHAPSNNIPTAGLIERAIEKEQAGVAVD